jgi:hypothetical protein
MRGLVCLWMVVVLGAAGPVVAAKRKSGKAGVVDSTPPRLTHTPVAEHKRGAPLLIEAEIVDESGVFEPALLVRARGDAGGGVFQRVPLAEVPGTPGRFAALVPEALLGGDGIDYVIEAFDVEGNGPVRAGEMATPLQVSFSAAEPVAPITPPTPAPAAVAEDEAEDDNTGLVVGSVVGVSVVVALAAAAGTAAAVYFLRDPAPGSVRLDVAGPSPFAGARP